MQSDFEGIPQGQLEGIEMDESEQIKKLWRTLWKHKIITEEEDYINAPESQYYLEFLFLKN
jgi:hypothetical protein